MCLSVLSSDKKPAELELNTEDSGRLYSREQNTAGPATDSIESMYILLIGYRPRALEGQPTVYFHH